MLFSLILSPNWLKFDAWIRFKTKTKMQENVTSKKVKLFRFLRFVSRFQLSNFGIQRQVAGGPDKKSQQLDFLLFLPTVVWSLNLGLSNNSQKISKWWEMTSFLFVCDNYKYKFKWRSARKWKYGGIHLKLKNIIWKIWKSFRYGHWTTLIKL